MPYNKGDFTQQGVAGYVNGGLLLNNKRDVTTRISTDEESAGIDSVDIKIKDRLNDIEYHITGENLTEGENVIGGGGGSNIPLCQIKFVNTGSENGVVPIENPDLALDENGYVDIKYYDIDANGTLLLNIPIYKFPKLGEGGYTYDPAINNLIGNIPHQTEDYTNVLTDLNNISVRTVQTGNAYYYNVEVIDETQPSSFTYSENFANSD